jgi:aryl-phospho-beta-D-glucosidase BglC (GH1 family)
MKNSNLKKILSLVIVVALLFSFVIIGSKITTTKAEAAGSMSASDFLKVSGTDIKNNYGTGKNVYLRGTNAGGWLVQESWMNPTNAPDQKTMMDTFKNRFGTDGRDALIKIYEDNYWTTADFDNCAALGMSVIRLPFTYMNLVDDNHNLKQDAFSRLDWFVDNCSKRGIYVILDLHGAFGSQNGMDHSGEVNDGYQLYWNDYNRNKTFWLWSEVAKHYKGNPAVAGYDILNEPGPKAGLTGQVQWDFYNEIYNTIRAQDSDHIIIMESCWNPSDLPNPNNYGWTNVVYEYHYYPWDYVNNADGQKSYTNDKIRDVKNATYGVPTFVGEFTCFGEIDAWYYTLEQYNANGFHWTSWAYKSVSDYGSWGIYNHNPGKVDIYNDSYDTIADKWSKTGASNSWKSSNSMVYDAIKTYTPGTVNVFSDDDLYYILAESNNKYLTVSGLTDTVLATSTNKSDNGKFALIARGNNKVSLLSASLKTYLCAVLDENNQVVPRSNSIGTWEEYVMTQRNNDNYFSLLADSGKYLTINNNGLYALSDTPQYFYFEKVNGGTPPTQPSTGGTQPQTEPSTEAPTQPSTSSGNPDLIITNIKTNPTNIEEGDEVIFTATVKNQGDFATLGEIIGVRFSVDGLNNEPFMWDDTYTLSIGAGESVDITATGGGQGNKWTATKGNHTIFAWVDDQGRVANESNTNNNTYTKQITVSEKSVEPPVDDIGENDVYLSSATPENSTINSDDKVKFTAMLRNIGENKTGDLEVTFYLDNKKLETVEVPSRIEAGRFIVVRTTAEWNSFMGSHTVRAVVKEKNTTLDLDNTNNASKSRFNVNDN